MVRYFKARGEYIRLLLSKRSIALMAMPGSLLGLYDALVSQLAVDPTKWPKIHDFLPGWSWQSWCLIALISAPVFLVERAYPLHVLAQNEMGKLTGDDVSNAIARLNIDQYTSSDGNPASKTFFALSDEFTTGIEDWRIIGTLQDKLGGICDWNGLGLNRVLSPLILAGVVSSHRKEGARPRESGGHASLWAIPADVYTLTDLGIRVVNRSRDDVFSRK